MSIKFPPRQKKKYFFSLLFSFYFFHLLRNFFNIAEDHGINGTDLSTIESICFSIMKIQAPE